MLFMGRGNLEALTRPGLLSKSICNDGASSSFDFYLCAYNLIKERFEMTTPKGLQEDEINVDLTKYPKDGINGINGVKVKSKDDALKYTTTFGDMHGNSMKVLWSLIQAGAARIEGADKEQQDIFDELWGIYNLPWDGLKKEKLTRFNEILENNIKFLEGSSVRYIGDLLADRGKCDIFTLEILSKAKKAGVGIEVLLSNHDVGYLQFYQSDFKGEDWKITTASSKEDYSSLLSLQYLMQQEIVNQEDVKQLTNNVYFKNNTLRLISYEDAEDGKLNVFMHTPALWSLPKLAKQLGVKVNFNYGTEAEFWQKCNDKEKLKVVFNSVNNKFQSLTEQERAEMMKSITSVSHSSVEEEGNGIEIFTCSECDKDSGLNNNISLPGFVNLYHGHTGETMHHSIDDDCGQNHPSKRFGYAQVKFILLNENDSGNYSEELKKINAALITVLIKKKSGGYQYCKFNKANKAAVGSIDLVDIKNPSTSETIKKYCEGVELEKEFVLLDGFKHLDLIEAGSKSKRSLIELRYEFSQDVRGVIMRDSSLGEIKTAMKKLQTIKDIRGVSVNPSTLLGDLGVYLEKIHELTEKDCLEIKNIFSNCTIPPSIGCSYAPALMLKKNNFEDIFCPGPDFNTGNIKYLTTLISNKLTQDLGLLKQTFNTTISFAVTYGTCQKIINDVIGDKKYDFNSESTKNTLKSQLSDLNLADDKMCFYVGCVAEKMLGDGVKVAGNTKISFKDIGYRSDDPEVGYRPITGDSNSMTDKKQLLLAELKTLLEKKAGEIYKNKDIPVNDKEKAIELLCEKIAKAKSTGDLEIDQCVVLIRAHRKNHSHKFGNTATFKELQKLVKPESVFTKESEFLSGLKNTAKNGETQQTGIQKLNME